jgi:hypothetical protein
MFHGGKVSHNSHPLFPGLVSPSGQKVTLGLLAFRAYTTFLALLQLFKGILEVVFWEWFSTACDPASIT